jgi:thioredoxin reductase (NADPH)
LLDLNDCKQIIPTIVFPDGSHLAEPDNEELAQKLGLTREAAKSTYDVVVIGGGPTGLTTVIYAAREDLSTLVIEKSAFDGQAGITERLDNYPGFPDGIEGAGIHFCATCDGPFYKDAEELVVLGVGNSGLEEGLFLTKFAEHVTVLEQSDKAAGSKMLLNKVSAHPDMELRLSSTVTSFNANSNGRLESLTVTGSDAETYQHLAAAVFVFIGLDPNRGWLNGLVDLDERGFVTTDRMMEKSVP